MKFDFYVEVNESKVRYKDIEEKVKESWKADGKLIKDLKTAELYYKPLEERVYYIANGIENKSVSLTEH